MKLDLRRREQPEATCVYCRDTITESVTLCSKCEAPFHKECRRELGRCSTPGCTGLGKSALDEDREWLPLRSDAGREARKQEREQRRERERERQEREREQLRAQQGEETTRNWSEGRVYSAQRGVVHDPGGLAKIVGFSAFALVLVVGFLSGGTLATRHEFHLPSAFKWATLSIPAGVLGVVYGYLQGLVGLRDPQPEGWGMLTMFCTIATAGVGFYYLGTPGAVIVGVMMSLICGRLFGFDPGKGDSA